MYEGWKVGAGCQAGRGREEVGEEGRADRHGAQAGVRHLSAVWVGIRVTVLPSLVLSPL